MFAPINFPNKETHYLREELSSYVSLYSESWFSSGDGLASLWSDLTKHWMIHNLNSDGGRCSFCRKCPDGLWCPHSLLFNRCRGSSLRWRGQNLNFTIQMKLAPRLRMTGGVPLFYYTPSWLWQGQLYFFFYFMC